MIKKAIYVCCVLGIIFSSCSKLSSDGSDSLSSVTILEKTSVQQKGISIADTIVPVDAINAKKFGVAGDGATDDTEKLQKLINTNTNIFLPAGTYIINKTINLRSNVKLYGETGATILPGNHMSGTLLTHGRYFYLESANNCLFYNITFKQPTQSFALENWSNACIYAAGSKGTNVISNTFNFNFKYTALGIEAVWFTGSGTTNTIIKGNKLYTVGIEYAEAGASSSLVEGNYIKNAHGIGINAHGNSDTQACLDNIVSGNTIESPGYMGIEDWGNTSGTIIKNNIISHTGQDVSTRKDAIGISAVGSRQQILNNQITDAWAYYIETGGGAIINENIINDTEGLATGIILNYTAKEAPNDNTSRKVIITNNQINNCDLGISYYGTGNINTLLQSNIFKNPKKAAVSIDSEAQLISANVIGNNVLITKPAKQLRGIFQAYTRKAPDEVKHNIIFDNNSIQYDATAKGSTGGGEYVFYIASNNTNIKNNSIKSAVSNIYAVSNSSDNKLSLYFNNNKFTGVQNDLSGFNLLENLGNIITK